MYASGKREHEGGTFDVARATEHHLRHEESGEGGRVVPVITTLTATGPHTFIMNHSFLGCVNPNVRLRARLLG